ncbi:plakophilin-1 isoform X2 [Carassius gibelio]|uniref:plakophilin-1 isoform X2 n=1 Tax=Carassius gibelio TaxID=101364 RepID=UPI002277AE29|nr:plakophilin-1 isoform X2 [Carassius gibelio]
MTAEPIRSALGTVSSEDTSLVLPSDTKQRTGQQRVLEQVNSIKRSKSKIVKNDSIPSPTTPASATEYSEPKFQFSPTKLNDTLFKFSSLNMTSSKSRTTGRSLSVRNTMRRQTPSSQWESQMNWNAQSPPNGMRRGGSDPALNKAAGTNSQQSRSSTVRYNRATGQSMRLLENNLPASTSQSQTGRSLSVRNTVRRQTLSSQWESQMNWNAQSQSNGMRRGVSDPALNKAGGTVTQQSRSSTVRYNRATGQSMRLLENNLPASTSQSQVASIKPPLSQSQTITKVTTTKNKSEAMGSSGGDGSVPNITLQEAVEYLSHSDISHQLCGASFIQHHTFTDDRAKQKVSSLGGIPALVQLLKCDNPQLQQISAAALRNVVFKDNNNKLEVESFEGIEAILTLLRNTNIIETQKHLTGLLWNLSSADKLKPKLIRNAMPLLTERVVVPYNFWTDSSTNKPTDPEVFYNTTNCLRNLSCASEKERISMRSCPRLIDSLMSYVLTRVERADPDDKSVENCVCILHNLSYQLEKEAQDHFKLFSFPDEKPNENTNKKSLFSPKSTKTQKEFNFPAMEKKDPKGVDWLYNQKSLQMYLSLLCLSENEATLEACCGALQNLTASKSHLSTLMNQSIIEKLQGLSVISPLLISQNLGLQKTAVSLVGNMSRVSSLRGTMAKQILPNVSAVLSSVTPNMVQSDSTIATACRVMNTLMLADPDTAKKVIDTKLVDSLSMLSSNTSFDAAKVAAAVLLRSMWGQKDIQNVLKKKGMNKDKFVNTSTTTAYKEATRMDGH